MNNWHDVKYKCPYCGTTYMQTRWHGLPASGGRACFAGCGKDFSVSVGEINGTGFVLAEKIDTEMEMK